MPDSISSPSCRYKTGSGNSMVYNANRRTWVGRGQPPKRKARSVPLTSKGSIASDDWITHVVPELELRMAQYEEGQIEFVILALVKEPLTDLLPALAENIRSTISFSERLSQVNPDWEDFVPNIANRDSETSYSTLSGLGVEDERLRESIDQAELPSAIQMQLENENVQELLAGRQELVTAQAGLRASIRDQTQIIQLENERAARRRHDKGLLAKGLLQVLGRMGKIGSAFGNDDEY
ncbi:MAG: hypothetical protein L6R35_000998 [Caloplaca aegaea]|nr:MAG: hypothetical protein L6R35_000998 [Caloplaca aegaea]